MQCDAPEEKLEDVEGTEEGAILNVCGLTFGYSSVENLKGIEIKADKGEFIALMGPNGSGKTTLMRCINRVLRIRKGKVEISGQDVSRLSRDEISRLCTTVPADIPTDFSLNTREFVTLGRSPYMVSWMWESEHDMEMVDKVMWDFGIQEYSDRKLHELSSGERARALLAKGVVQEPKLMMVDEPSAHLDLKYKVQVMEMLKGLSRAGITVIMASHDINLVTRFCDKVMLLSNGKSRSYGAPNDVITTESIRDVFDTEVSITNMSGITYVLPKPPSEDDVIFKVDL